jgi:peptidylprolyl isomerase
MRRAVLPALAVLAIAGCGSSSNASSGGQATSTPTATATATAAPTAAPQGGPLKDLSQKPAVKVPKGKPPKKLVIKDIVKGKGKAAHPGEFVTVQYVGDSWSTGKQFDASWDHGQPFQFPLGAGQVIPGWDKGVKGMRVGGRRELIIPPRLGYGAAGSPPAIKPNETLIFIVDLKRVG